MKLFIISKSENGINNINGKYYLVSEEGETIAEANATSLFFARLNLYEHNEEVKKLCDEKYKDYKVEFLKIDTTTDIIREKLVEINK